MNGRRQPTFFSAQISAARRFYLDLNPPPGATLAVVCGGCEHCAADYEIHRPDFPYWSIEFVARGRGRLVLDGKHHDLVPAAVYAYGPGIAQDIVSDPKEPMVKYFLDFAGKRARGLLTELGLAPGQIAQTSAPSDVANIFDDLIRNGRRETPYTQRIATSLLEHLLFRIAETSVPYGAASTAAFATFQRCKQHLAANWKSLRSLAQVAAQCHVAPAHLCRLFQRFDHQTPYQYLLRLKMQHAAERLQTAHATIKQVAEETGFTDVFHFSRVFKSVIGLSPSQLVKLNYRGR